MIDARHYSVRETLGSGLEIGSGYCSSAGLDAAEGTAQEHQSTAGDQGIGS